MTASHKKDLAWSPLGRVRDPDRDQLAKYLNRVGRGIHCRLDVPVLVIDDVKWAAKIFGELSEALTKIAFDDGRPDVWRVLAARYAMESAKRELHTRNERKIARKSMRKAAASNAYER